MVGICPPQNQNERLSFNMRNVCILFCYAQVCFPVLAFFLFKANTVVDYGSSFFTFITMFAVAVWFLVIMWQIKNILSLIDDFDQFIENSKYTKNSQQAQVYFQFFFYPKDFTTMIPT